MTIPPKEKSVVAAFDFDGTITKRDSLLSFLTFTAGKWQSTKKLALLAPYLMGFLIQLVTRQEAKETILKQFFQGIPYHQLKELGCAFAKSSALSHLISPASLKRLDWHRSQNHRCILISASIDAYLEPWSRQQGFHDLICSQLEVDPNGIITGHLQGLNCWGLEKERRLLELLGPRESFTLYAYGDSRGDSELLNMAEYPFYRKMPSPQGG